MFKMDFPRFSFFLSKKTCWRDPDSLLQQILCWLFGCCPNHEKGR